MTPRKTILYRLDIDLPAIGDPDAEEYDPTWAPPAWTEVDRELFERDAMRAVWADGGHVFEDWQPDWGTYTPRPWPGWPSAKLYFSRSGAEARAKLFRRYGASVRVVASEPVVWTDAVRPAEPPRPPLRIVASRPAKGKKRAG